MNPKTTDNGLKVERIHTGGGSHIEPPFDESWSDLEKLRWEAAVVECDTGLHVAVYEARVQTKVRGRWRPVPGLYSFNIGSYSVGSYTYDHAWTYLNGLSLGATVASKASLS